MVMPYSNKKWHIPPSIPETPYQTLIIPCPDFDPIYQVILLENSNVWILFQAKEGSLKRKGARIEKKKGKTSYEELHVAEKENEIYKLLGEILSKER
jgi:hypothetical protein